MTRRGRKEWKQGEKREGERVGRRGDVGEGRREWESVVRKG